MVSGNSAGGGPKTIGAKPVVIREEAGSVVDVAHTNEKGYKKSLEQGGLWVLHDETGRLLPYADDRGCRQLSDHGRWFEAVLSGPPSAPPAGDEPSSPPATAVTHTGRRTYAAGREVAGGRAEGVLSELYALIEQRKRDLPEGSYTTHLFREGLAKIKKKTGEEAIELLLADEPHERIHEAADLIYHLLVLLVECGIRLSDLLDELESR